MRIVFIGEAMLELSRPQGINDANIWRMGYGGDTLNTAIHMARSGHDVAYFTALGADPFSDDLKTRWRAEGIDTSLVLTDPLRTTGLYAISTDAHGERNFAYWRSDSAARQMFDLSGSEAAVAEVAQADVIAYSLITLAILAPTAREKLFALCKHVRGSGGKIVFDGNYRPRLWAAPAEAIAARDAALACADIGLPTLEDEALLAGARSAVAVAAHWQGLGCDETLVKLGANGCRLPNGQIIAPPRVLSPLDTSGAGDAFNGGYLGARLSGANVADAAMQGHRLAGWVVMHPGAIPPRTTYAPYVPL